MTVLLNRSAVLRALDIPTVLDTLRDGFRAEPELEPLRIRTDLPGPGTATALLPGVLPGIPAYTVKVNAKFPGAAPALRGVVCLHDLTDGALLAILDSATVTTWRTGLAAALATDLLATDLLATNTPATQTQTIGTPSTDVPPSNTSPPNALAAGAQVTEYPATDGLTPGGAVGVVGAGVQAGMTVRGLAALRGVERLVVYDLDRGRAAEFLQKQGISGTVVDSPGEVARQADVVVLATWSREPLLTAADIRPGLHLTTLGADEPGKVELSADLLAAARVVVDDRELAGRMGALGNVGLTADAANATLTDVLTGRIPGRRSAEEVTVYAPVGLPWQDLAIAWPVYQSAKQQAPTIDFLG